MAPKLYLIQGSSPCRAVLLTLKALGISAEQIEIDPLKGENLTPEYLKMNVQHTVPTFKDDDGKVIWDSHAINIYLVTKYGKDDALYPADPYKRAVIDQRLHFDSGVMWAFVISFLRPMFRKGVKTIAPEQIDSANEIYTFLEKFLEGHQWAAGDSVSLADFSLYTSASTIDVVIPADAKKFPNITAWFKRVQSLPYFDVNRKGHEALKKVLLDILNSST